MGLWHGPQLLYSMFFTVRYITDIIVIFGQINIQSCMLPTFKTY